MYYIQFRKHLAFNNWSDVTGNNGFEELKDAAHRYWQERKLQPIGIDLRVVYRNGKDTEISRHKLLEFR